MAERKGRRVTVDWYDGPLREVCLVEFDHGDEPLIEVTGIDLELMHEAEPMDRVMRFSRKDLQIMMDLLDGKPVQGFFDRTE